MTDSLSARKQEIRSFGSAKAFAKFCSVVLNFYQVTKIFFIQNVSAIEALNCLRLQ